MTTSEHLRLAVIVGSTREGRIGRAVSNKFDDAGRFLPPEGASVAAKVVLDQLSWWAHALRDARTAHPYAS